MGVPGVAGGLFQAGGGFINTRGKNVGVYGAVAGTNPAIGVLGEGGSGRPGVMGQAGSGNANGVEGHGSGNFAGVAGFGDVSDSANSGIGVFAVGGAPLPGSGNIGGPGVYAVGVGGAGYLQINQPVGVYGVGGGGAAPGICGVGAGVRHLPR